MRDPRLWKYGRFWAHALFLGFLFLVVHLAGFETDTAVLSGANDGDYWAQVSGIVYLLLYIIFVCIVPILVIADGLLWLGGRLSK